MILVCAYFFMEIVIIILFIVKLVFSEDETGLVAQLCEDLHCSAVMKASVEQLCRYWKLSGMDYEAYISQMYAQGLLPCKDKREGKRRIDAFRKELL